MTASQRAAMLEQAQVDARRAVDDLLDAIGRVLIAHVDLAVEQTTERTPPPSAKRSRGDRPVRVLTVEERVLAALVTADAADMPLDASELEAAERAALTRLSRARYARTVERGLWRPTLAGLNRAREWARS